MRAARDRRERPASAAPPSWQAQYFANPTLTGTPVLTRTETNIDYDWGAGSPATQVPVDQFSARWTATIDFAAGDYRFSTFSDDGIRLFVDGQLVIDKFVDQPPTEWQADVALTAGAHTVELEYLEAFGDASVRLSYSPIQTQVPGGTWHADFFGNKTLSGQPLMSRGDPVIDFEWGEGVPGFGVPFNNFSVRWTRTLTLSAGTYRFDTATDDGVRLKIDGNVVIDDFVEHPLTTHEVDVPLSAGDHVVVMEYFEGFGEATAKLNWALRAADGVDADQRRRPRVRGFGPQLLGRRRRLHGRRDERRDPADLEHDRRSASSSTSAPARSATRCRSRTANTSCACISSSCSSARPASGASMSRSRAGPS